MRKASRLFSALAASVLVLFNVSPALNVSAATSSTYLKDGWYYIKNINSQKYMEVSNATDKDFANVAQYAGNGNNCQKWYVKNLGSNYITLQNGTNGGRMLDVYYGGSTNGTNIDICKANGSDAQTFKVKKTSNGNIVLLTKTSGNKQAVDVTGWSKDNNANIATWEYNGLECQQFKFEATENGSSAGSSSGSNSGSNNGSNSGSTSTSSNVSGDFVVKNGGMSLADAVKKAKKGQTIVIDGTVKSGAIELPAGVNIAGKNNATIDFSSTTGSNGRGITLSGNGSTISNVTITKASDNGIFVSGSNNTFDHVTCSYNEDAGFQVSNGGANNKFYSCYSHHNADAKGENADGFAVKLHSGEGNYFENCKAEYNSDDGWDCYAAHGAVTLVNCQANYNGYCNGIYGDGNGFKMGGVDNKTPGVAAHLDPLQHQLIGCIAKGNYANGFDRNNQSGVVTMKNCTADSNKGNNYNWPANGKPSALGYKVTFGKAIIQDCTNINGKNNITGATLKGTNKGF